MGGVVEFFMALRFSSYSLQMEVGKVLRVVIGLLNFHLASFYFLNYQPFTVGASLIMPKI